MIGRKQTAAREDEWSALRDAAYPDQAALEAAVDVAVEGVRRFAQAAGGRIAYAWSGGKDSQALRVVCELAGVEECVIGLSACEWPAFLAWVTLNMPDGLDVRVNRAASVAWVANHPDLLFPDSRGAAKWFKAVQHKAQDDFSADTGRRVLVTGRRLADGNYCGARSQTDPWHHYANRVGLTRLQPIAGWSHELTMGVIQRYAMPLPPCYDWPRGFQVGTGSWPARQFAETREQAWAETRAIDLRVVEYAAEHGLPGAAACLEEVA